MCVKCQGVSMCIKCLSGCECVCQMSGCECVCVSNVNKGVTVCVRLQASGYNILLPTTAMIGYTKRECEEHFGAWSPSAGQTYTLLKHSLRARNWLL